MGGDTWGLNGTATKRELLRHRTPAYATTWGARYEADCRELLAELPAESVSLVFTSPPFALRRQKAYGNPPANEYIDWFMPIAGEIQRVLRDDGSFVMELGSAWNPGLPTVSLMPTALKLALSARFHLCQEFTWHKTRPLPSPIEWVCRRRLRVTEATTQLWWWSKSPEPWCDQRAVLVPYARPLHGIKDAHRPSGYEVNGHTWRDNGGAIPTNVFALPPVDGRDPHGQACRAVGATIHPCRMRPEIPTFFVRFCTSPGAIVVDPFGGSNTTGQVAEAEERRWLTFERHADYVRSSRLRFGGINGQ